MPNITGATNFFPKAYENTVPMTLGGSILAGAATVPVNGMTNYTDGDVVCFVVDGATPALKQVFTGTKSGANIINAVWTEFPTGGVNVAHSAGATVIDYVSATHWDLFQKGATQSINQDGSLKTAAVQTALNITGGAAGGWTPTGFTPNTVTPNGNRSYTLTFNAHDLTPQLTPGMRLQMIRTVTAPTQCTALNGTTQYYSKTTPVGMTFTNNWVESAWIKVSAYPPSEMVIAGRYNGTSGFNLSIISTGQVQLVGYNAGSVNFSRVLSNQSVPLNKWVHVAAQHDMATFTASPTTSYVMIDGVDVPAAVSRGGTNPTSLINNVGNLEIGSTNGGTLPFNGKIAQVAIYSAKVTEATILASMHQTLAGTETSLISAYSFNNSINDLNANANNLTANGSAVATTADTPFTQTQTLTGFVNGTTNYGIVQTASFSTNTTCVVQVPEGDTLPASGGISAVSYATNKVPYGFPAQRGKWEILAQHSLTANGGTPATNVWVNINSMQLSIPAGEWIVGHQIVLYGLPSANGASVFVDISAANNTGSVSSRWIHRQYAATSTMNLATTTNKTAPLSLAAQTTYYVTEKSDSGTVNIQINPSSETSLMIAENAYL